MDPIFEAYQNTNKHTICEANKKYKVYSIVNNGISFFITADSKNGNVYTVTSAQLADATFTNVGKDLYIEFK